MDFVRLSHCVFIFLPFTTYYRRKILVWEKNTRAVFVPNRFRRPVVRGVVIVEIALWEPPPGSRDSGAERDPSVLSSEDRRLRPPVPRTRQPLPPATTPRRWEDGRGNRSGAGDERAERTTPVLRSDSNRTVDHTAVVFVLFPDESQTCAAQNHRPELLTTDPRAVSRRRGKCV